MTTFATAVELENNGWGEELEVPPYGVSPPPSESVSQRSTLLAKDRNTDWIHHRVFSQNLLQWAHLINTVRSDILQKRKVEQHLANLRVLHTNTYTHAEGFKLDGFYNGIFLTPTDHLAMDFDGSWLPCPSLETLQSLKTILEDANRRWDAAAREDRQALRIIDFNNDAFKAPKFEILLLRWSRDHPFDRAIFHRKGRDLLYVVSGSGQLRFAMDVTTVRDEDDPLVKQVPLQPQPPSPLPPLPSHGSPLEPFQAPPSGRTPAEQVNPLVLTIFNYLRLKRRKKHELRQEFQLERSKSLESTIKTVTSLIYYKPQVLIEQATKEGQPQGRRNGRLRAVERDLSLEMSTSKRSAPEIRHPSEPSEVVGGSRKQGDESAPMRSDSSSSLDDEYGIDYLDKLVAFGDSGKGPVLDGRDFEAHALAEDQDLSGFEEIIQQWKGEDTLNTSVEHESGFEKDDYLSTNSMADRGWFIDQ
ncbi:hypothetical protein T439DRAFT_325385 [Meredithblackwellia eburnea MCA 4105]